MNIIDIMIGLIIIAVFLVCFLKNPRKGFISAFVFTSLALPVFPWAIVPIERASIITQIMVVLLALIVYGIRKMLSKDLWLINKYNFMILVLFIIMIVYLPISNSYEYGLSKTIFFLTKAIMPIFAMTFFTPLKESDLKVINNTLILSSFFMALRILPTINASMSRLVLDSGEGPLVIARILGMGATLLLIQITSNVKNRNIILKATRVSIFMLLVFLMLLTGSRGPIVFIFISVFLVLVLNKTRISEKIKSFAKTNGIVFIVIIGAVSIMLVYGGIAGITRVFSSFDFVQRYSNYDLLQGSDNRRLDLYYTAWNGIIEAKGLGIGTGGFPSIYHLSYIGRFNYPHNLFLESALELGILGFAIVTIILVASIKRLKKLLKLKSDNVYLQGIIALTIYFILDSLISGDIGKNYPLWIMLSMTWGMDLKVFNKKLNFISKNEISKEEIY